MLLDCLTAEFLNERFLEPESKPPVKACGKTMDKYKYFLKREKKERGCLEASSNNLAVSLLIFAWIELKVENKWTTLIQNASV